MNTQVYVVQADGSGQKRHAHHCGFAGSAAHSKVPAAFASLQLVLFFKHLARNGNFSDKQI
jgi:hypothetical protein